MLQLSKTRVKPRHYSKGHQQRKSCSNSHCHTELFYDIDHYTISYRNRYEYHHNHHGNSHNGKNNFLRPIIGSTYLVLSHLHMAVYVLQDHDGVIHQDTNHQRECHQAHQVQCKAKEVHTDKGCDERGRDRDHDNECIAQAVEEEEHHHGYEYNRQYKVKHHRISRM